VLAQNFTFLSNNRVGVFIELAVIAYSFNTPPIYIVPTFAIAEAQSGVIKITSALRIA